jgi:hypothetical protein
MAASGIGALPGAMCTSKNSVVGLGKLAPDGKRLRHRFDNVLPLAFRMAVSDSDGDNRFGIMVRITASNRA